MDSLKRSIALLVAVSLLVLFASAVFDSNDAAAEEDDQDEDEEVIYVCPNHPEVWSTKPGVCPKCGAELVKKKKKLSLIHI